MTCTNTPSGLAASTPIVVTAKPSLAGIEMDGPCAISRLPLSSTALTQGLTLAGTTLVCDQVVVAAARVSVVPCHLCPPSKETSTAATTPPVSEATPVKRPVDRLSCVISLVGGVSSVDAEADARPGIREPGCTCMSANKLIVACCISTLTPPGASPTSLMASSPCDHRNDDEANTNAPATLRYCVASIVMCGQRKSTRSANVWTA